MVSGFSILLVGLLAIAFGGKSIDAIKCHQCSDCLDAEKLSPATECSSANFFEAANEVISKVAPNKQVADANKQIMAEIKKKIPAGLPAESCYKLYGKGSGGETVRRGCSTKSNEYKCNDNAGMTACVCGGDGCNSAPTAIVPSLLVTALCIVTSLMINV